MSQFSAEELEARLEELMQEAEEQGGDHLWSDGWYTIQYLEGYGDKPNKTIEVSGFGIIELVEHFGGEGQGDDYWTVFKIGDRHFRKTGWYSSWEGASWDGAFEEVYPEEYTAVRWITEKKQ